VKFWIVAIVPLYIGWVLGQPAAERHLFIDDLRVALGIITVGPFLGTSTLLLNAYYDMFTTDRANPRKRYTQVVEELISIGLMDRETLRLASFGFAALGLLLAAYVSYSLVNYGSLATSGPVTSLVGTQGFTVVMVLITLLSIAYSHPALRWKGVPGLDLLTNMIGFGIICPLAGWVLMRPLEQAPWWYFGTIALFLGAVYAPTTASDYEADKMYGIRTLAVHLGIGRTLVLGFAFQAAAVVALAAGWSVRWFPFSTPAYEAMKPLWPFLGLQILFYIIFIRRPTVGRIWALLLLLSVAQGLGVLLMLWGFVQGHGWKP
jgi:4-hydroxybenzoate polyprenyltransferase